jgi:hypothetical protein
MLFNIYALMICAVMFLASVCLAQTNFRTANESTASLDFAVSTLHGTGVYAMPFAPLLSTPIVALHQSALQVGASNSAGENFVGAQNATTSVLPQRVNPVLIVPRLAGVAISYDLYPKVR